MARLVTPADVEAAADRIAGFVRATPVLQRRTPVSWGCRCR